MEKQPAPPITFTLIEWLQRTFPDKAPEIDASEREVWASVGVQRVIRKLRHEHEQQTKDGEMEDVL